MNGHAIWLAAGLRTPFARVDGPLARLDAVELSLPVVRAMTGSQSAAKPDLVVWGTVIPNLGYSNIAREVQIEADLDRTVPAFSTVLACSTSMVAALEAASMLGRGGRELALVGGVESMSRVQIGLSQNLSDWLRRFSQARSIVQRLASFKALRARDIRLHILEVKNRATGKSMGEHCEEMAKAWSIARDRRRTQAPPRVAAARAARRLGDRGRGPSHRRPAHGPGVRDSAHACAQRPCLRRHRVVGDPRGVRRAGAVQRRRARKPGLPAPERRGGRGPRQVSLGAAQSPRRLGRARPPVRRDWRADTLPGGEGACGDAQREPRGGEHLHRRGTGHRRASRGRIARMNSAAENFVEISGLGFAYGERKLLKGLSLKIPRGKVVAILGASGTGKSTLLRLIGGQARPDRGTVKVAGEVVHELGTHALYV